MTQCLERPVVLFVFQHSGEADLWTESHSSNCHTIVSHRRCRVQNGYVKLHRRTLTRLSLIAKLSLVGKQQASSLLIILFVNQLQTKKSIAEYSAQQHIS